MNAKYRIVTLVNGQWAKVELHNYDDLRAYMRNQGNTYVGKAYGSQLRDELYAQPQFAGFHGPMWDGDAIRYENLQAYRSLSQ